MKDKDIPFWNPIYSYEDQSEDVKQFWFNEAVKLMEGVTINGVYIHPWLYWHINFWKMMVDLDNGSGGYNRVPGNSELRDNEWLFAEFLKQAEDENKGIFMFGCRRFGKALLNSEILYLEDREKSIGEITVGDKIFDNEGKLVKVTGVYPQGVVMTYRVIFDDGRSIICSGDHLWKVKIHGEWKIRSLRAILSADTKDIRIPICDPVRYPKIKLPVHPSFYATMIANYLIGLNDECPSDPEMMRRFLRSSIEQKKEFCEYFIRTINGVVSGDDKMELAYLGNKRILNFVQRMFWSYGWYAGMEGNVLHVSNIVRDVGIDSVTVYGRQNATCITVDNMTKLFLTTNYIVTHNTAIMSSLLARNATMTYNLVHNVIGASKEDLAQMSEYLEFGLDNLPPFLRINRTGNDWTKEVILGNSTVRNERDVHARIRIVNIDSGKASASLKPAGGTPYTTIYDEVGKFPVLGPYLAGQPSHMMHGKMRGMVILSGCITENQKVYTKRGVKKAKDVKLGDKLASYNHEKGKVEYSMVDWIKPESSKLCFIVRARSSNGEKYKLECSYDHPFYCKDPGGRDRSYEGYVPAILLEKGDTIYVTRLNPEEGSKLEEARVDRIQCVGMKEVYNFRVLKNCNYFAERILTHNTGGNVERSQDAQKIMSSPEDYRFIVMNYDLLNKHTIRPTWRICKSGCFVPAQMSHAFNKHKTTLDKYLGIENAPGLKKIKIKVSDFDANTEKIQEDRNELAKKDRSLFVQRKMAYPLTVDDCFLNANVNRFPVEDALIHKSRLLEEGRPGMLVDIYQIEGMRMGWKFSEKQLAGFPFQGGNIDCPVVIYENPPEEGGVFDFVYASGCDPYRQDKANTESLGAFYIVKRLTKINDPFANCIVASYVSRPGVSDEFCRTVEILIEAYGAKCLMENADRMLEMYLARRNKEYMLLEDGEKLANKIIRAGSRQNNKLGLSPTVPNQSMLYNTVLQYCWEDVVVGYDDDGMEITQKGIYRIPDVELLDEIIAFGPGVNTDRIIAFGHALLLAKYYDDMGFMPESKSTRQANEMMRESKIKKRNIGGFTVTRHNPYASRVFR